VQVRNDVYAFWTCGQVGGLSWSNVFKFKITDQRYKPADTSYLEDFATRYAHDKAADINQELEEKFYAELERAKDVSEIPESKSNAENVSDWWDYEAHKPLKPAPVGAKLIVDCFDKGWKDAVVIGEFERWNWLDIDGLGLETVDVCRIKPLDHSTRKAEAEKKRVVDAAFASLSEFNKAHQVLGELYDAGFLRMPAE